MLILLEQNMGELKGAALVGRDIAFALQNSEYPLTVVSQQKPEVLNYHDFLWLPMPLEPGFPRPAGFDFPQNVIKWSIVKVEDAYKKYRLRNACAELVFINRMNKISERIGSMISGKKIQIIHSEPERFSGGFFSQDMKWGIGVLQERDCLVFVSSRCRHKWMKATGLNIPAYHIPNCAREERALPLLEQSKNAVRERLGFTQKDFIAVCPATLYARKNQGLLVDMFAHFREKAPGLKLYLIGLKGEGGNKILEKIEVSPFKHDIIYLGPLQDMLDYIYAADFLVLPSLSEALPLVVLEAMVLKTPVIASDVGGLAELVDDKETGFLFSLDRPEDLVTAVSSIYSNQELRKKMAEKASQKYWANFSRDLLVKRYNKLVNELMAKF